MRRLTPDGTVEPFSRDQFLRRVRGQGNIHFPCSADHDQDWQPYPIDPYSAMDAAAELGRNPVSKHQIQPEYGDEQADVGRDG